jgi:hypothetical protein
MVALSYGQRSGNSTDCATSSTYCAGAEEESTVDMADYGSQPIGNAAVVIAFDPVADTVSGWLNGASLFSRSPPSIAINTGTSIHLGGGGDLSQPAPTIMREAFVANTAMSSADDSAVFANITAFYGGLPFE